MDSIVDLSRYNPAINPIFSDTKASDYWSSTTLSYNTDYAWSMYFSFDCVNYSNKSSGYYVRAVRGGQIRSSGHLVITSPKQGDFWNIGEAKTISWDTQGISGNVSITLSRDGGKNFSETLSASTPNDGSFDWTVSGNLSYNCMVKITPLDDPTKTTSQGLFSIYVDSIPQEERDALIALYNSTDGDNWTHNDGWKTPPLHTDGFAMPGTECDWYGIECTDETVVSLNLGENQLAGSIPPELGNLSNLQDLEIYNNQINGAIPPELGNLSNLRFLELSNNLLAGSIPSILGNLNNLQFLLLGENQLAGSIPPELGNLSNLLYLDLEENQLTGSIPPELGNLSSLLGFYLYENQLTGTIPEELGNLGDLEVLSLSDNQLDGSIPPELGNLSNLHWLRLNSNQLTGSIPSELGNLSNLSELDLCDNQLTGSIPAELGNLCNLHKLDLNSNQLTGTIPMELGNLSNLYFFLLGSNKLTGPVPSSIQNLTGLTPTDIGYKGLFTNDASVSSFLDLKDPDWQKTQTIAPSDVVITSLSDTSVELTWTPILYTGETGGYSVLYSETSGGPYTLIDTTMDKTVSQMVIDDLTPGTNYFFVVQTKTGPHTRNQNTVYSDYSEEVYIDSDNDGLPDSLEISTDTNPNDADTDDDGILDGEEDINKNGVVDAGETDPRYLDSDKDGIQDGTEIGLRLEDVGPDTNTGTFIQDKDPNTTTDPLEKDSDGDGINDGEEDTNKNGALDAGESDPTRFNGKLLPFLPLLFDD